jgi:hypothetical protein
LPPGIGRVNGASRMGSMKRRSPSPKLSAARRVSTVFITHHYIWKEMIQGSFIGWSEISGELESNVGLSRTSIETFVCISK